MICVICVIFLPMLGPRLGATTLAAAPQATTVTHDGIYRVDLETLDRQLLQPVDATNDLFYALTTAPDGTLLAASTQRFIGIGDSSLVAVDPTTGSRTTIGPLPGTPLSWSLASLPDGRLLGAWEAELYEVSVADASIVPLLELPPGHQAMALAAGPPGVFLLTRPSPGSCQLFEIELGGPALAPMTTQPLPQCGADGAALLDRVLYLVTYTPGGVVDPPVWWTDVHSVSVVSGEVRALGRFEFEELLGITDLTASAVAIPTHQGVARVLLAMALAALGMWTLATSRAA